MTTNDYIDRLKKITNNMVVDMPDFSLKKFCGPHKKQFKFISSKAKRLVASCSRRAGKSTGEAGRLVYKALTHNKASVYYICNTRDDAEAIMWDPLVELCDFVFGEKGYNKNITKLEIQLPNKTKIKVTGCPDIAAVKRFLGRAYAHVTIDECQDFAPEVLRRLINKAIIPALIDFQGSLAMIGTPSLIHAGPFYEANFNTGKFKGWQQHAWTMADNPWLEEKSGQTAAEILQEELDRRELTEPDAEIQREFLGMWVQGDDELVYHYNPDRNTHEGPLPPGEYTYILGVDLGYKDETAFCVLAYNKHEPELYQVADIAKSRMDITDISDYIKELARDYDISKVIFDSATGGANWVAEINKRYGIYAKSADKQDKEGYIKVFNDCLRKGVTKLPPDAGVISEWMKLGWRTNLSTGKRKEDPNLPNHRSDAFLYAFRECYQYMFKPAPPPKKEGSGEWVNERVDKYKERQTVRVKKPRIGKSKRGYFNGK